MVVLVALVVFAGPLFVGLDRWDMRNDEAIYSYAVERILELDEWLTPRSSPTDLAFLEKPPLKFWIVAGAMAIGATPNNEFGMRIFDAIFGTLAFAYVMAFAYRAAGPAAGAVALLVLFSFHPLLFDHGLRSNNMEAALILSYCGGLYHFQRWTETERAGPRRLQSLAVALYCVLGLMTKFVAIAFLPMVALAATLLHQDATARARRYWRDWIGPGLASLVLVLPWFIYESLTFPNDFWPIILGEHVVKRFSSSLDPSHLAPWHYYFTYIWNEFSRGGSAWFVATGLGCLLWRSARGSRLAQLLVIWAALPLALMSVGSSKVGHYALPFLPPLAIGAGWVVVEVFGLLSGPLSRALERVRGLPAIRRRLVVTTSLTIAALALAGIALWTLVTGAPTSVWIGDMRLFTNSSALRPAALSVIVLLVAGRTRLLARLAVGTTLFLSLPISTYAQHVRITTTDHRPLRAARECMQAEQAAGRAPAGGVFLTDPKLVAHPPFFYFRHVGPWRTGPAGWREEVARRAMVTKTPVLLSDAQWRAAQSDLRAAMPPDTRTLSASMRIVRIEQDLLLLLPGAYASCEAPIISFGGQPIAVDTDLQ